MLIGTTLASVPSYPAINRAYELRSSDLHSGLQLCGDGVVADSMAPIDQIDLDYNTL